MPLIAFPFIFVGLAALLALGAAAARGRDVTPQDKQLWEAIAKAQQSGSRDDYMAAANIARLIGKPKTADALAAAAVSASPSKQLQQIASKPAQLTKPAAKPPTT